MIYFRLYRLTNNFCEWIDNKHFGFMSCTESIDITHSCSVG